MNKLNITFVTATKQSVGNISTNIFKYVDEKTWIYSDISAEYATFHCNIEGVQYTHLIKHSNTDSLSKVYNDAVKHLSKNTKGDQIVVFVHDDVFIRSSLSFFYQGLYKDFEKFDIVGAAGSGGLLNITEPTLWHIMSDRKAWAGAVSHPYGDVECVTTFGPQGQRCILVDGLIMCTTLKTLQDNNLQFDNQFSFHCYDLDFCLAANEKRLKIGVFSQVHNIFHVSPGLKSLEDPIFKANQEKFLQKWGT